MISQLFDLLQELPHNWQVTLCILAIFALLLLFYFLVLPATRSGKGFLEKMLLFCFSLLVGVLTLLGSMALGFFALRFFL